MSTPGSIFGLHVAGCRIVEDGGNEVRAKAPGCLHLAERHVEAAVAGQGDAGLVPVVWEPIYTASKHAVQAFVHTLRRQVVSYGVRVGAVAPGPVVSGLLNDWPKAKMEEALAGGSLMDAVEVAEAVLFMLTRPQNVTVRDLVILPNGTDFEASDGPLVWTSRWGRELGIDVGSDRSLSRRPPRLPRESLSL